MKLSDFDYNLPKESIAQHPAPRREDSRLMLLSRADGSVGHRTFRDFPLSLKPGDLLVLNDTKVIPARLIGVRSTGARVEVLLLDQYKNGEWRCLVKPGRRVRPGDELTFAEDFTGKVIERLKGGARSIRFEHEGDLSDALEKHGRVPLPPYIKRETPEAEDAKRYQTVYARQPGAVAAPTAGLHFTERLIQQIKSSGVAIAQITLHVGLGTFKPVAVESIADHTMESEWYEISENAAEAVNNTRSEGGRIIAAGTTSVRTLESAWDKTTNLVRPGTGWANLFITPGYEFKVADALLTNFHLPKSTLLMLVSAFAGLGETLNAYDIAIAAGYRFYSYGDCMFIS